MSETLLVLAAGLLQILLITTPQRMTHPQEPPMATYAARESVEIQALRIAHVPDVVAVHLRAFPRFFLTLLGPRFLGEFYRSFTEDRAGIGFVAIDTAGRVFGVVVGTDNPHGFFRRLVARRWPYLAWAVIGVALRRPSCWMRLFRGLLYRGDAPSGPPRALLNSLAVAPEVQSRGVGRRLVEHWLTELRRRHVAGCYLTTDADDNEYVNRFYRGLGWRVDATYRTAEGRRMNRYIIDFPSISRDGD